MKRIQTTSGKSSRPAPWSWLRPAGAAALLLTVPAHAASFVYHTATGYQATADLDANGVNDILLVDRATGLYRVGYISPVGAVTWAAARPSGMTDITGMAVGRLNGAAQGFAVTSPAQNRIHVLRPGTSGYTEPLSITGTSGVGPALLGAADITGGALPTAEDDLVLTSILSSTNTVELRQLRTNAGSYSLLDVEDVPDGEAREGNTFLPVTGAAHLFGYIQSAGATDTFRSWELTGGNPVAHFTVAALPAGSSWVPANLEGTRTDMVFYKRGTTSVRLRRVSATAPWTVGALVTFTAPESVEEIVPVNAPGGTRLLMRFTSGALSLYGYTAAGGMSAAQPLTVTGAAGVPAGLLPMGGNAFQVLFAPSAGQSPTSAVLFTHNGTAWIQSAASALPGVNPFNIFANVFALSGPLFRTVNPEITRTWRTSDWTTGVNIQTAAPYNVTSQAAPFVSSTAGVGASTGVVAGSNGAAPGGSAANQLHEAFSLFAFDSTLGIAVDNIFIAPGPGAYDHAVQLQFSGISAGGTVYYRKGNAGPFTAWSAALAPWIFSDTDIQYYAQRPSGAAPIQSARYTFTQLPARQDADRDGVPDFVEVAKGLNPAGGPDADGDGYSDLTELKAGTDPNSAASAPAAQPAPASSPLVDVIPQPRQANGTADGTVGNGTQVMILTPAGTLLGQGSTTSGTARFALRDLAPEMGFAIARTEPHFVVSPTTTLNPQRGPEMLAILPALPQESWSYGTTNGATTINEAWSWGGANFREGSPNFRWPNVESTTPQITGTAWESLQNDPAWGASTTGTRSPNAWITELQAATSSTARPYLTITLTPESTLRALLMEEIASLYFAPILNGDPAQRYSLTPDRARNAAERRMEEGDAATLRTANPDNVAEARYRMLQVLRHIDALDIATKTRAEQIAREIYKIIATGTSDAPLDALRSYLRTGVIPPAYRTGVSFSNAQIATTWNQLITLRNSVTPRPVSTYTMTRSASHGTNPWLLTDTATGNTLALINADGQPAMNGLFSLPEVGDEVLVQAYTDTPTAGGYPGIEPLSFTYQTITWTFADADSDGDLLGDEWERRYFGTLAYGGTDQRDGSAWSLLQEYFESTNPTLSTSSPGVPPVFMGFSNLRMSGSTTPGFFCACVNWPAAYSHFVDIRFDGSSNLSLWGEIATAPAEGPPGQFTLNVDPDASGRRFFRPYARLRR